MNIRHAAAILAKTLVILSALLIAVIGAAVFALPVLLKSRLPAMIQQYTGGPSTIADIQLGLFPLALKLQGVGIKDKNDQAMAAFDSVYLQLDPLSSITGATLVIDKVLLSKPFIYLARHKDGAYNFSDLIKPNADNALDNSTLFPVIIKHLSISAGKLAWKDKFSAQASAQAFTETLAPIQLDIVGFNTRTTTPSRLSLALDLASGGHLNWEGTLGINPVFSAGHIKLDKLKLQKIPFQALQQLNLQGDVLLDAEYQLGFAENKFKLSINKAKLDARKLQYETDGLSLQSTELTHNTDLEFNYADNSWQIDAKKADINSRDIHLQNNKLLGKLAELDLKAGYKISYTNNRLNIIVNQGQFDGQALQFSDQDKPLATLPTFAVQGVTFNLDDQQLNAASIAAGNAAVKAWLKADGTINYQDFLSAASNMPPAVNTDQKKRPQWRITADSIALTHCTLDFEDQRLAKPYTFIIKPIDLTLSQFSNQTTAKLPFQLKAGINNDGLISLSGNASIEPLSATLDITVKNIDLAKYQPYFDQFIRLDIIDGMLAIDGQLSIAKRDKLELTFNGNTEIAEFLTRDQRVHKDFVKWEKLSLKDIAVDVSAGHYFANTLIIDKPYARVTIRKDQTINFAGLVVDNKVRSGTSNKEIRINPAQFKLAKLQIKGGSSDFTDLSLILPFSAYIQGLNGGANGISSERNSSFDVVLKGNAYDLAPVDLTAKISPYLGNYDVKINFKGLPMPLVSPYMVQFAGYKVEKGKLSLGLDYKIANQQLTASNNILIDQFELGEKIDNPKAVSIPIKLAVALLKDSSGKIKFAVPITGSLENPQFSLGAIIVDALVNAIGKITASPFTALASLLGGGKDLSSISFAPGSSALDPQQQAKLVELSKAFQERPHLTLEIKGITLQQQDWPAISDEALYDQLKIRRADEINQKGAIKIRPEYVELSQNDYQRLLADMFIEKFPRLAKKSLSGTPELIAPQIGDFYSIAKQKLLEIIKPEQERLRDLAVARAQSIAKFVVQKGGIAQERVYILDPAVNPGNSGEKFVSLLSLQAN